MDFRQHVHDEVLRAFVKEDLPSLDKEIVKWHLSFCPICQKQRDKLLLDEAVRPTLRVGSRAGVQDNGHIGEKVFKQFWRAEIKDQSQLERISLHCLACHTCRQKKHDLWLSMKEEGELARANAAVGFGFLLGLVARARRLRGRERKRHNRRASVAFLVGLPLIAVLITASSIYLAWQSFLLIPIIDREQINIAHSLLLHDSRPSSMPGDISSPAPQSNNSVNKVEGESAPARHRNTPKRRGPQHEGKGNAAGAWEYIAQIQELNLRDFTGDLNFRGANKDDGAIKTLSIVPSRTRNTHLRIDLPENSRKGWYIVSIQDPARLDSPIDKGNDESSDGRQISVFLDLRSVPENVYQLSIMRKDEESDVEEFLGYFSVRVGAPNDGGGGKRNKLGGKNTF